MPPCLQKDPGEAEGGGFTGGNDGPMVANDIYASWKKGNDRRPTSGTSTSVGTTATVSNNNPVSLSIYIESRLIIRFAPQRMTCGKK